MELWDKSLVPWEQSLSTSEGERNAGNVRLRTMEAQRRCDAGSVSLGLNARARARARAEA